MIAEALSIIALIVSLRSWWKVRKLTEIEKLIKEVKAKRFEKGTVI